MHHGSDGPSSSGIEENIISRKAVLERQVPWDGLHKSNGVISDRQLELIKRYDKKSDEVKKGLLDAEGPVFAELFMSLITKINSPETTQYVLTLIHDLLVADPKRAKLFIAMADKGPGMPLQPFIDRLRNDKDYYIAKTSCAILGILMSRAPRVPDDQLDHLLRWAIEQIRRPASYEAHIAATLLQALATKDEYRVAFANAGGLPLLVEILRTQIANLQLLYETTYVVWLLMYNEDLSKNVFDTGLIRALVDIVKVITKEKVLRLAIAALRNLVDKSTNNEEMIDAGFVRMLAILQNKKWGDEDIIEDIKVLSEAMAKNMVALSSFDMYKKEVQSQQLEWSPVHKSEKFWRENCSRFEENDYQLLRLLQRILQTAISDPLSISVALYDIGEFVRFHPRGRSIIQQMDIKMDMMKLMTHDDAEVKKQALFATQKTMVHNWEYLTK